MISTSIKLDGEQEFKRQLGDVNSNLRTLKSEMQLTTEEFKGQANSVDALEAKGRILTDQLGQQEEKVRALEAALQDVNKVYKDQPKKIDEYQQSLNRAKTELVKLERELQDNDKYLREARSSFDKTASSIDGFGKAVDKADSGGKGGLAGFVDNLGGLKKLLGAGVLVGGIKSVADGIIEIVDSTEEYRKIMGALEVSSQAAGYTAEQTSEAYNRLYGILGDTQASATTIANLQAIGLSQESLMLIIDQVTGAWAKYGDSIPIDGLAESINETIQAGQVTGVFADVLNWAGTSEDAFNERLETTSSKAERVNLVMNELAMQGLTDVAEGYRTAEAGAIAANEAQARYEEAMAELGEVLLPAKTALVELATEGWGVLTASIQTAMEFWNDAVALINKEKEIRADGFFVSEKDRMAAYGYEAYYTEDGLLRYRQSTASELANANTNVQPAATASDISKASAAISSRTSREKIASGDIVINITEDLSGATVARRQYRYNQAEAQRRGVNLVNR